MFTSFEWAKGSRDCMGWSEGSVNALPRIGISSDFSIPACIALVNRGNNSRINRYSRSHSDNDRTRCEASTEQHAPCYGTIKKTRGIKLAGSFIPLERDPDTLES